MKIYQFSIRATDGATGENTGSMALPDDTAARDFAMAVIRDIPRRVPSYWTMELFDAGALLPARYI